MNATDATMQPGNRPAKILVVDDNHLVAKTISFKLRGPGYQVTIALDAAEAMAAVGKDRPDLILLDIMFPNDIAGGQWDGFRILEWIHRMDESRKIPIIIITSSEDVKYEERAKAAGAAAFFHKPIDNDRFLSMIRALLDNSAPKPA
jgi:two-component system, OmpR family, response regulator MprA